MYGKKTFKIHVLGAMAAFCAALATHAATPLVPIEGSVESTANQITLPGDAGGIVTVHACPTCATQTFYFAPDADLFLNGDRVSVAQLQTAMRLAGSTPVTVHYSLKDKLITRIVLVAR